eukprot:360476-Chlamydomonas_euryale.AAC.2
MTVATHTRTLHPYALHRTCGTSDSCVRRSRSPIAPVSSPSMSTRPRSGSTMRYSAMNNVDFPHPVRPHTPTWGAAARSATQKRVHACKFVGHAHSLVLLPTTEANSRRVALSSITIEPSSDKSAGRSVQNTVHNC